MLNQAKSQSGFLLIEVILAIALFALILSTLGASLLYGSESSAVSGNRERAVLYAEEGMEAVRDIRNQDFANLTNGTHGLSESTTGWSFSGSSNTNGIFTRDVEVSDVSTYTKEITVTVDWQQTLQRTGQVVLTARFTDWQREADLGPPVRVTTYEIESGFTGTLYTLELHQDLAEDYFAMVIGASTDVNSRGPNEDAARIDRDPHGNFALSTNADELRLRRGSSNNDWLGVVVVVESLSEQSTNGFTLEEVIQTALPLGSGNTLQSVPHTLSANHNTNTVPYGGLRGGGVEITGTGNQNTYSPSLGIQVYKTSPNVITFDRYGGGNQAPQAGTVTTYIVEWGSNWDISEETISSWNRGGNGANATGEYQTSSLSPSVTRAETWLWGSTGLATQRGIGNGSLGKLVTLGDGVTQLATESVLAVGSEYTGSTRDDTIYVHEHSDLVAEYRFKADGDSGSSTGNQELVVTGFNTPTLTERYTSTAVNGVISAAAMDGSDGGMPVFYGSDPLEADSIGLAIDEDELSDTERNHTSEQVAYWVFDKEDVNIMDSGSTVIGETGSIATSGTSTATINFRNSYTTPIIVASYTLPSDTDPPAVIRVSSVTASSAQVYMQNPGGGSTPANSTINYVVMESGNHTLPGGDEVEAGSVSTSNTNHDSDWGSGQQVQITPTGSFTTPRVLGQVMSDNDSDWSHFWASNGTQANPPTSSAIYVGKHVAQDSDTTRSAEDVGYIIIEDGSGTTNGADWEAGITSDTIFGVDDSPAYNYSLGMSLPEVFYTYDSARFVLSYETSNGTGTAFSRPVWSPRFEVEDEVTTERQYGGQNNVMWFQSVDFGGI